MNEDPDVAKWNEGMRAARKAQRARLLMRIVPVGVVLVLFGGSLGVVKWVEVSRRNESERESQRRQALLPTLSADERSTADRIVADARARAKAIDAAKWSAVLGPPPSTAVPSSDACPVDGAALVPKEPGPDATTAARRIYTSARQRLAASTAIVSPDGTKEGRRSTTELTLEEALTPHLAVLEKGLAAADTGAAFLGRLRADVKTFDEGHDGVLVARDRIDPVFDAAKKSFTDGRLRGHFYLVSRASRAIVCVADVDTVGPHGFTIAGENESDLEGNARDAVARLLTADAISAALATMTRAGAPATAVAAPAASGSSRTSPRRR